MTIKTHIAGDHRFDGYGNVEVDAMRHHRGWQLTCCQCGGRSEIHAHKGRSYPPKLLYRWFREKGWKLSGNPAHDVCPACLEKTREKHREERKQYVNGSADRLIEGIRLVDKLMTASVTAEYGNRQPDVAAAMCSLIETAFLCNMLKREDIPEDIRPSAPQVPEKDTDILVREFNRVTAENSQLRVQNDELVAERDALRSALHVGIDMSDFDEPPPEPEPEPEPPPPPPESVPERIHPRTAAYLAEMRRKILGEGARK